MTQPIAFVLLQNPVTPNLEALVAVLRQRHPEQSWDLPVKDTATQNNFILCGKQFVVVMAVDAPVPNDDNLWARSALTWPAAREAANRHRAHFVVSLMGANSTDFEHARVVTAVTGGLLSMTHGVCAVIMAAKVARSPEIWAQMSQKSFAPLPDCPFMLWVDIAPFRSGQSIGAHTVGLSDFVGREIEFDVPGMDYQTVINRVAGLASYLIELGDVIKDGHTIGVSESNRIKVHHGVSRFNGAPVLQVGADGSTAGMKRYPIITPGIAKAHPLLVMLSRVGLFDAASAENQVQLRTEAYVSEVLIDSYEQGLNAALSKILSSPAYVDADKKARLALDRGDPQTAQSAMTPIAKEVGQLLAAIRHALGSGNVFMFQPR
jgi:hypothetical protein